MHITLERMERAFPQLNHHPHTFADVERVAGFHRLDLTIEDHPSDILGYLATDRESGKRTLVINSRLDDIGRTFVGFHELGHFFLHVPTSPRQWHFARKCAERTKSKHENEADAFALVAMIPMWMLCDVEEGKCHDELHPAMLELYTRRRELWKMYGI